MDTVAHQTCETCGKKILPRQKRFCSKKCYGKAVKRPDNVICYNCKKPYRKPKAWSKKVNHDFCSRLCYAVWKSKSMLGIMPPQLLAKPATHEQRMKGAMRGADNPAWKGGVTFRRRKGKYPSSVKYVRCPAEFISMARSDGYIMEHRLVMAKHLGRALSRSEVVHHVNHDVTDNRIDNLQLFASNAEHKKHEGETGYFKEYYAIHHNHTKKP